MREMQKWATDCGSWEDSITLTWEGEKNDVFLDSFDTQIWNKIKVQAIEDYTYKDNRHEIELQIMCEDMGL